jgi:tRNA modification GTPase
MDTIYALASARGRAGIAVIRLSGPDAFAAGETLARTLPPARQFGVRKIRGGDGALLDEALVLCFDQGHSFTGEPVVEFHLHGGVATVNAVLRALGRLPTTRPAEAGEFTRRALENERLDLAQVEGLADLIDAETEAQRRQALRVLSGALGDLAASWRNNLIRAAALLEATIDFADEEVPVDVRPEVDALLRKVRSSLASEFRGLAVSERIRDGFEVAIVGPPNAGKSTLLNALAGREAAITSEIAGTTRDVIEVRMDLRGLPVTILDTAGLREARDSIEAIGIARALERASSADLRVFLIDGPATYSSLDIQSGDILIQSKVDLQPPPVDGVSGETGQGVSALVDRIAETLETRAASAATATRERHRIAIERAILALDLAESELNGGPDHTEFTAAALRDAVRALDSLVGMVDVENILDEIFSSFCIGK